MVANRLAGVDHSVRSDEISIVQASSTLSSERGKAHQVHYRGRIYYCIDGLKGLSRGQLITWGVSSTLFTAIAGGITYAVYRTQFCNLIPFAIGVDVMAVGSYVITPLLYIHENMSERSLQEEWVKRHPVGRNSPVDGDEESLFCEESAGETSTSADSAHLNDVDDMEEMFASTKKTQRSCATIFSYFLA